MALLEWVAPRVNAKRFSDLFVQLANHFVRTVNLGDLSWLCTIFGHKKMMSKHSMHVACIHGDLVFAKAVMELLKEGFTYSEWFYDDTFVVMCESGDLEKAKWIFETDQAIRGKYVTADPGNNWYPGPKFRNICSVAGRVLEKGQLHVLKWIYSWFSTEERHLEWIEIIREKADNQACSAEMKQWIAGLSETTY